ncbi:MAG: insulinase family protein [Clostridia bacterium]|nr:insulinase family protein [Clostridia bacterium]
MKWNESASSLLREHYYFGTHKSGLPIYVFPKRMTGTYAILSAKYGSLDHRYRLLGQERDVEIPDGVAHFLEHKLFENEDGSDSFRQFTALGADANAYTTYNRTAYLFSCTEHFSECLAELLNFVFHPYFTDATVKKEQGIIAEEIRMYEDSPWDRADRNLLRAMYQVHPVRKNILGSEASLATITPELLYECHRVFYHPSNMALVVCGDVEREEVAAVADRILTDVPRAKQSVRVTEREPDDVGASCVRTQMQVAKPLFCIGFKDIFVPRDADARLRRDAAMSLLGEMLFSRAEPFYNGLFEEGLLTSSYGFGYSCADSFGYFGISGEAADPEQIQTRLYEYLDTVRKNGLSEESFLRCRHVLYADEVKAYDSTEEIADRLLCAVFDGVELFSYPSLLQDVTMEELYALMEEIFDPARATLSVIEPFSNEQDERSE